MISLESSRSSRPRGRRRPFDQRPVGGDGLVAVRLPAFEAVQVMTCTRTRHRSHVGTPLVADYDSFMLACPARPSCNGYDFGGRIVWT